MTVSSRKAAGQSIAELPVAIAIFLFILLLPMVNLATIALRSTNVFAAARNAAFVAGRSSNFDAAVQIAKNKVKDTNGHALAGVEIKDSDVKVTIIGSPLVPGKSPVRQTTALNEVDPKAFLYQIEVQVTGKVEPIVTLNKELFGKVPGLTEAMTVTSTSREFCEHPRGFAKKS